MKERWEGGKGEMRRGKEGKETLGGKEGQKGGKEGVEETAGKDSKEERTKIYSKNKEG